jgi:hypothetical protein
MEDLSLWGAGVGALIAALASGLAFARPKAAPPPTAADIKARKRAHRQQKLEDFARVEFAGLVRDKATGRPKIDPDPNRSPELKAALRAQLSPAEREEFKEMLK